MVDMTDLKSVGHCARGDSSSPSATIIIKKIKYMEKEDLIKMINERGNIKNVCNLTSYVTSHQNEFNFEIENNVLNLVDEKNKRN